MLQALPLARKNGNLKILDALTVKKASGQQGSCAHIYADRRVAAKRRK